MDDIAQHVGVSRTTVSFVLNNRPGVAIAVETRERILAAARDLGYRPNAGAQALAARRTRSLGLVTEIVTSSFGPEAVRGAQEQASRSGLFLMIAATHGRPDQAERAVERLLQQRVEGLMFASGAHQEVGVPAAAREVPTVLVHCFVASGDLPAVLPDEEAGGYRATRRLLDARHRRIGLLNLEADRVAAHGRLAGYRRALSEAGVPVDEELVSHGPATADVGYAAAAALLDRADPPTAFFCGTDRTAMGAYDAIKERGLSIPGDVAVIGFDNQELIAAYLRPALTTVQLPFAEMGATAVELLSRMIAGEPVSSVTVVDCPLIERASV